MAVPTWQGFVETTRDALHIFEACFNGTLPICSSRPRDRSIIVSGNVFVYDEANSGIIRWTDGIQWSPSRILTNFLIYRQLDDNIAQRDKRRARKQSQREAKAGEPYPNPASSAATSSSTKEIQLTSRDTPVGQVEGPETRANTDRRLVGSLMDSYRFKNDGLLKKAITITMNDLPYHLIAYYSLNDAKFYLKTPRDDFHLKDLWIRDTLLDQTKLMSFHIDDTGDEDLDQANRARSIAFDDHQNGFYPPPLHLASPYNVPQDQALRPLLSQGIDTSPHPPLTGPGSAPTSPYDVATCYQRACACACHYQNQFYPQQ